MITTTGIYDFDGNLKYITKFSYLFALINKCFLLIMAPWKKDEVTQGKAQSSLMVWIKNKKIFYSLGLSQYAKPQRY